MKHHFQVNWVNGMKITSNHFIELENHFVHRIQNSLKGMVTPFSYGLLPGDNSGWDIPKFSISFNENKLRSLTSFSAVTPEGFLIEIPANLEFSLAKPITEASSYYLIISIKPFDRVPFGLLNEEEKPLRFPDSIAEYQFQLVARDVSTLHTVGDCVVPVGKFFRSNFEEDKSYIPPCSRVNAHPALMEMYNSLHAVFNDLEKKVLEMLGEQNISNRIMLVNLLNFFSEHKIAFDWHMLYQPPIYTFEMVNQLARTIYYSSSIQNSHYNDQLNNVLHGIMANRYDHLEIAASIANVRQFTDNYLKFLPKQENIFGV